MDGTVTYQRGYKYRLYPTSVQEELLRSWQETHRRLWNALVIPYLDAIQASVKPKKSMDQCREEARASGITESKALEEAAWVLKRDDGGRFKTEVRALFKAKGWSSPARTIADRDVLRKRRITNPFCEKISFSVLDEMVRAHVRAWDSYFSGITKMPRYKTKRDDKPSVRVAARSGFKVHDTHVELSSFEFDDKRSKIRFQKHRPLPSQPTRVAIMSQGSRWFVVFGVTVPAIPMDPDRPSVGIDRGVVNLLTDSTGQVVPGRQLTDRQEARMHWLERRIAKKQKGSGHWHKWQEKLRRFNRHVADVRADVLHKESRRYADTYSTVVLEDLKVTNMTRSAKGTVASPGVNVAQKAGLNRSILSQGWSMFDTMLAYKLDVRWGTLRHVDAKYTSQTCVKCGHVDPANRPSQAVFKCVACGYTANADVNAAQVIHLRGTDPALASKVVVKKAPKKLFTVTGRKKTRTTPSVDGTPSTEDAAVGRTVKLPVEDGGNSPPDDAGNLCPSTSAQKSDSRRSETIVQPPLVLMSQNSTGISRDPSG